MGENKQVEAGKIVELNNPNQPTQSFSPETIILLDELHKIASVHPIVAERVKHFSQEGKGLLDDLIHNSDGQLLNTKYILSEEPSTTELLKAGALIMAEVDRRLLMGLMSKGYNGEGESTSSQVNRIEYAPKAKLMTVTFKSGAYEYADVPLQVYLEARNTDSIGSWVSKVLKANGYAYQKVN